MAKEKIPVTAATRILRAEKIHFESHLYDYEEKGGTATSSRLLGVDEHCIIKTLIMEDELKNPLIILMHGDLQVSTKELARQIGCRQISTCNPDIAQKHSGYMVGGTSPFGVRRQMPVYLESSIAGLPVIYINGGKRGYLVSMSPAELVTVLKPVTVTVGIS